MEGDRRAQLVDAGVRFLARVRFEDVLGTVDTRLIAEAAQVTTGSFFHHFRTRAHFARAVVDRFVSLWNERVQRLTEAMAESAAAGGRGIRLAAGSEWERLAACGPVADLEHLLWAVRNEVVAGTDSSGLTAGDVLRQAYRSLADASQPHIEHNLRSLGRQMLAPFDARDLSTITNAVAEGLQMRAAVDPDAVRPDLYADTMAAVFLATTQPRVARIEDGVCEDLDALMARVSSEDHPVSVSGGRPEAWRHIADAAAHLFVERSPHEVRIAEVAAVAGVPASTVAHIFGGVRVVAACSWVRHVPELRSVAEAPLDGETDPLRRIEAVLIRYVELVRANPGAAEALIGNVLAEVRPGSDPGRHDVRSLVPIPAMFEPHVAALRRSGRLRRRVEVGRLARSLVQVATTQALLFPADSVARVVDEVLTLVFDGALVEPSDA